MNLHEWPLYTLNACLQHQQPLTDIQCEQRRHLQAPHEHMCAALYVVKVGLYLQVTAYAKGMVGEAEVLEAGQHHCEGKLAQARRAGLQQGQGSLLTQQPCPHTVRLLHSTDTSWMGCKRDEAGR